MGFGSVCGVGGMMLALCAQTSIFAQSVLSVPFVGCKSDGQTGPMEAPSGTGKSAPISREAAQKLAYYKSGQGIGVLAPRGWHCFGTYGSSGDTLIVSPELIDPATVFTTGPSGLAGPAIQVSYRYGGTSGRFQVAEIIARVFPAYKAFVTGVMKENLGQPTFVFGPYPADTLTYKSKTSVEYRTPARAEGLGTHSWLPKNESPIDGVAILIGPTPDLVLLSVRLPPELSSLTTAIVGQVERDAASLPGD